MQTFQASLFDELTPIYPDTDTAQGTDFYRVAGANGTYAGVHIVLRGLTPGIPSIGGGTWPARMLQII